MDRKENKLLDHVDCLSEGSKQKKKLRVEGGRWKGERYDFLKIVERSLSSLQCKVTPSERCKSKMYGY